MFFIFYRLLMKQSITVQWDFNYNCNWHVCFDLDKKGYKCYKPQPSEDIKTSIKELIKLAKKFKTKAYMIFNSVVLKIENPNYSWDKLYKLLLEDWNSYMDKIRNLGKDTAEQLMRLNANMLSEKELIDYFVKKYPELKYLVWKDVNATPDSLFGKGSEDKELKRTIAWIISFYKNFRGDWHKELTKFTREIITWPGDYQAMEVSLVINDLTKSQKVVDIIKENLKKIDKKVLEKNGFSQDDIETEDHDKLLYIGLKLFPEISPSFQKLSKEYQEIILEGLSSNFNFWQFIQWESLPSALFETKKISAKSLDFLMLHTIYDIAWAAWHVNLLESTILTEFTAKKVVIAANVLREHRVSVNKKNAKTIYKNYFNNLGKEISKFFYEKDNNLYDNLDNETKYVITRLSCLFRFEDAASITNLIYAYNSLPANVKEIIKYHFEQNGINDRGFLLYYLPAFVSNFYKNTKDIKKILLYLANFYHKSFIEYKNDKNWTYTIFLTDIVNLVNETKWQIDWYNFMVKKINKTESKVMFKEIARISKNVPKFNFEKIKWKKLIFMWIWWWGDAIQAFMIEKQFLEKGVNSLGIVSIRKSTVWSSTKDVKEWESRVPENAEKIENWVYKISPASKMKWRFFEKNTSLFSPTYLVLMENEEDLKIKLEALKDYIEKNYSTKIDWFVGVDTGWDALYRFTDNTETDSSKSTPDQDVAVLNVLEQFAGENYLIDIAPTIDSPDNLSEIIENNNFKEIKWDLENYLPLFDILKWEYYSKTTDVFKKALQWKKWLTTVDIPVENILNEKNPWDCFVNITEDTRKILLVELKKSWIKENLDINYQSTIISKPLSKEQLQSMKVEEVRSLLLSYAGAMRWKDYMLDQKVTHHESQYTDDELRVQIFYFMEKLLSLYSGERFDRFQKTIAILDAFYLNHEEWLKLTPMEIFLKTFEVNRKKLEYILDNLIAFYYQIISDKDF